jgi:hypothetical protein
MTLSVGLSLGAARDASAQSLFQRLNLDRLRLTGIGVAYGPVQPKSVVATQSYGVQADYGAIAPHWRVVFSASYWGSRFTDATVQQFVAQLRHSLSDTTVGIDPGKVTVSDIALEVEGHWIPTARSAFVQPYLGVGIGAHVVNAEGKLIDNTFVESALDNIASGFTGIAGVAILPSRRVSLGVEGRYTLLSTVRFGTLRATAMYHFDFSNRPAPPSP